MSKQKRRRFTADQKAHAVLRHLQDRETVSSICESLSIHPNQFYNWQKEAMSNLSNAFVKDNTAKEKKVEQTMDRLKTEQQHKDSVIAELLSEHLALKKSLGEN